MPWFCCVTGPISGIVVAIVVVVLVGLVSVVIALCLCWKKKQAISINESHSLESVGRYKPTESSDNTITLPQPSNITEVSVSYHHMGQA